MEKHLSTFKKRHQNYQKFRRTLMYLWFLAIPLLFNWMSPVLIIFAGTSGIINFSYVFFGFWFISSFFVGRLYCSTICPWGAIQEDFGYIVPKKLGKRKNAGRWVKYFIFAGWIVFVISGPFIAVLTQGKAIQFNLYFPSESDGASWRDLISFTPEFGFFIFYFGIQLVIALLFGLIFGSRSFCAYGCPMSVLGIIGTKIKNAIGYPSLHLEANKEDCIKCGKCTKACVMSIDVKDLVQENFLAHEECILCGSCIEACPNDVIHYAWKWKEGTPRTRMQLKKMKNH